MFRMMYPEAWTAEYDEFRSVCDLKSKGPWRVNDGASLSQQSQFNPSVEDRHMTTAIVFQHESTGNFYVKWGNHSFDFLNGAADFDDAHWLAIQYNSRSVVDPLISLIFANPKDERFEKRVKRAAYLAYYGHVSIYDNATEPEEAVGAVRSAVDVTVDYSIFNLPDVGLTCACPDFQSGNAPLIKGQMLCKHIMSYLVVVRFDRSPVEMAFRANNGKRIVSKDVPANDDWPAIYQTGESVLSDDLSNFRHHVAVAKTLPYNREKLYGWLYMG